MTKEEISEFNIFTGAYWKIPSSIFFSCLTFSEGEWKFIFAVLFFLTLDFVSGIIASVCEKKMITSHKLFRTAVKVFLYFGGIIAIKSVETAFPTFDGYLVRSYAFYIVMTEFVSFCENSTRCGFELSLKRAKSYLKVYNNFKKIR